MDLLERGIASGLIKFDEDRKNVLYIQQNKRYRYTDPEEQVRVKTYLELVLNYGYNSTRMVLEAIVPDRTPSNLADIVVYSDDNKKDPYIVVECKQQEITDAEFTQAIEQGFGNTNSLRAKFLWVTSGIKSLYFNVADHKPMEREANKIADIPVFGSTELMVAKYIKGGKDGFELEKVSEQELTRIFKQAHDALWAGGKRNPSEAFDELDKVIFCKLWDERALRKNGEPYDFQVFTGEAPDKLLKRIKAIYNKGKEKDPEVFREDIRLNAKELETVVGYLAKLNLTATDLDSKGKAFETFMGSFFRGEFGQYFTPRNIVKFIVESLPITNESVVLDTSCGSGGFLLYALDKVRKLADSKAYDGYFTKDSKEHWNFWHDFAEKRLYGVEISESIARTAKMNMIIHDDGHTNVVSFDGLESIDKLRETTKNQGFKKNRFNFIITNPPFGSTIKYSEHRYIEEFELGNKNIDWIEAKLKNIDLNSPRDSQSSEILFVERCHQYLRVGGILAIVIPDGILTNSSMQYVRDWIEESYRIIAVVSMPQTAFTANGAGVKSSVMFLQKYSEQDTAIIRATKKALQDNTFDKPEYGAAITALEQEKLVVLKRGDNTKQEIEEDFVRHIEALRAQGNLSKELERQLTKEHKEKVKEYEKSESFQAWKKETTEEYNERISNIKENLNDEYASLVKDRLNNYPIFMAIADNIGYDATGRETGNNELEPIAEELYKFIEAINNGTDSFFA